MWIRSQNKELLMPLGKLAIYETYNESIDIDGYYISCSSSNIGNYKTKERCIEVLNTIQESIKNFENNKLRGSSLIITYPVYEMPEK